MKSKFLSLLQYFIGWPFSLVAIFFIGHLVAINIGSVNKALSTINISLFGAGIIFFLIYYLLRGIFWQYLLRIQNHNLSLKETLFLWEMSEIKRYIPGNIWSMLGRVGHFSSKGIPKKTIASSLLYEYQFLVVSFVVVSLLCRNFLFAKIFPSFFNTPIFVQGSVALIILGTTFFLLNRIFLGKYNSKFTKILPPFSSTENLQLFGIMLLGGFFLGLGTYCSINSVGHLSVSSLAVFTGFFVFSYLVGFLSLIAPMGLGVREAVMAVGLAKFVNSFSLAGFFAIFSRIAVVFAELIFLAIIFLWRKISPKFKGFENFVIQNKTEIFLGVLVLSYICYYSWICFLKYENYFTGRFDLGNMDQTIWNTLHGRFFQLTNPDSTNTISRLAIHADFLLIFLAPFYIFWQDPKMLLILQTIVLGLGGIFVFLIAKEVIKNKFIALSFAGAFLLNPAVAYTNLYDFHAVTFATTFLLAAFYFSLKKKYNLCILFLLLTGLTKEEAWVLVGIFGLYLGVAYKQWLRGSVLFIFSLGMFLFLISFAIPSARGSNHFALTYYSDFGSSPSQIIKTVLFSPQKTLPIAFSPTRLLFLIQQLSPIGFLPLFSPLYIVFIIPELAIDLLSKDPAMHQIYYQYTAILTPFFFVAGIFGAKKLQKIFPKITYTHISFYLIASCIISAYFIGPLPVSNSPQVDVFTKPQPFSDLIDAFLSDIPSHYSIAATNNLGSHLSHRENIFTVPVGLDKADIILFLLNDQFAQPSLAAQKEMADKLKHSKDYIEIFKLGDFVVFEKRNLYLARSPNENKIKLFPVSIPTLEDRDFVGGNITKVKTISKEPLYDSFTISYSSDGLKLYARMDVPKTASPSGGFPIVIINHGLISPSLYDTESAYKLVSSYFAQRGFLAITPDYRNNGNSDKDTILSTLLSYPIDVLNLLSSLKTLPNTNTHKVFLWGHSTGAAIALTTLEVVDKDPNIDYKILGSAVWAPVIDPYRAYLQFSSITNNTKVPYADALKYIGTFEKNKEIWESVSPLFYLQNIPSPIQIIHGANDSVIPYQWSIELYDDLVSLEKPANLFVFPNADHTLSGYQKQALDKNYAFFEQLLKK